MVTYSVNDVAWSLGATDIPAVGTVTHVSGTVALLIVTVVVATLGT